MPNQEKLPRAWVYARIPGDCAATRASYDACCRQAGDDSCTVVDGSIDYKGHGPLRDGYQSMLRSIRDGKVNCVYVCPYAADQRQGAVPVRLFQVRNEAPCKSPHTGIQPAGPLAAIQVGKKNRSIRPTHRRSAAVVRLKYYCRESEGDTVWWKKRPSGCKSTQPSLPGRASLGYCRRLPVCCKRGSTGSNQFNH